MKNVFRLIFLALFLSCDDGDIQIETVDFDSINTVESCKAASASTTNLLFKINVDEALILELPAGLLKNEVTTEVIKSAISATTKLTYRVFTDKVSKNYFCDEVPPLTPTVSEQVIAADGEILITTATKDSITFEHIIRLNEISFISEDGSRITDLRISEFGTVTTKL